MQKIIGSDEPQIGGNISQIIDESEVKKFLDIGFIM